MKYRKLKFDEKIEKGDQYYDDYYHRWFNSNELGQTPFGVGLKYRRPIKPKKSNPIPKRKVK